MGNEVLTRNRTNTTDCRTMVIAWLVVFLLTKREQGVDIWSGVLTHLWNNTYVIFIEWKWCK